MPDRREQILYEVFNAESEDCRTRKQDIQFALTLNPDVDRIYLAMDENGRQMCLDLLTYVVKHTTGHSVDEQGNVEFKYKGEWISSKQLFENFL